VDNSFYDFSITVKGTYSEAEVAAKQPISHLAVFFSDSVVGPPREIDGGPFALDIPAPTDATRPNQDLWTDVIRFEVGCAKVSTGFIVFGPPPYSFESERPKVFGIFHFGQVMDVGHPIENPTWEFNEVECDPSVPSPGVQSTPRELTPVPEPMAGVYLITLSLVLCSRRHRPSRAVKRPPSHCR
jgi:hypothetical protein